MGTPITMPQLGESVVEGTIARWLKREGDPIAKYEPLVEVVTEKVNVEVPSPAAGIIIRLSVPEGATVAVGTEIAVVEEHAASDVHTTARGSLSPQPAPALRERVQDEGAAPTPHTNGNAPPAPTAGERRRYTPVVLRMAERYHLDLALVPGTGANGRVTKDDVQRFLAQREGMRPAIATAMPVTPHPQEAPVRDAAVPEPVRAPASAGKGEEPALSTVKGERAPTVSSPVAETVPLTPMRRAIAENLQRSASTIPAAWTMLEVDVTGLVRLRERAKAEFAARHGVELTYLPFVLQAVVGALRDYPLVNAVWGGDHILVHKQIHLGVAISVTDGLLVPVVRDADGLNLIGLARACADVIRRARERRLTVRDMEGATFTVNNPGTFGSIASQPIIPPGQGGILNVEAIVKRAVVRDDAIAIRSLMNICLSFDHRILDGREAIGFLQAVRQRLEAWGPEGAIE